MSAISQVHSACSRQILIQHGEPATRRLQYPLSSAIDVRRMMSDWKVELVDDNISEFFVEFNGPKDSASPTLFMQCCGVWHYSRRCCA